MTTPATWPADTYICIPAYKAAEHLRGLLSDLVPVCGSNRVCVVDDGSGDDTPHVCRTHGVSCIEHEHNRGKGAALLTGFRFCAQKGARWVLTMDADGQHAVADLPRFLDASHTHPTAGIIIGNRRKRPGTMPLPRIASNLLTSMLLSLICRHSVKDSQCGFRLYNMTFIDTISLVNTGFALESEVILKACRLGYDIAFIDVQTLYFNCDSHINHGADTLRWISAVLKTNFAFLFTRTRGKNRSPR